MNFNNLIYKILEESKPGKDSDYRKLFHDFYVGKGLLSQPESDELEELTDQTISMMGLSPKVEQSDSGNTIVKYAFKGGDLLIIGIMTKSGKLDRTDLGDLKEWISKIANILKSGKKVISSPNPISGAMMKKVDELLRQDGYSLNKQEYGPSHSLGDSPYLNWQTYIFTARK